MRGMAILSLAALLAGCAAGVGGDSVAPPARELPPSPAPALSKAASDVRGLAADTSAAATTQRALLAAKPSGFVGDVDALAQRIAGNMLALQNVPPRVDAAALAVEAMRSQYGELKENYEILAVRFDDEKRAREAAEKAAEEERNSALAKVRALLIAATALAAIAGVCAIVFGVYSTARGWVVAGVALLAASSLTGALAVWLKQFVVGGLILLGLIVAGAIVWLTVELVRRHRQQTEQVAITEAAKAKLSPPAREEVFGDTGEALKHLSADTVRTVARIRKSGAVWIAPKNP